MSAPLPPSPEADNTSLENLVGTHTSSIRLHCCTNILLYLHKEAVRALKKYRWFQLGQINIL